MLENRGRITDHIGHKREGAVPNWRSPFSYGRVSQISVTIIVKEVVLLLFYVLKQMDSLYVLKYHRTSPKSGAFAYKIMQEKIHWYLDEVKK